MADGVLIVGAGPVGMLLACELLQRGVSVRLIDDVREHSAHSRATVVWPRLLELMHHTGVTDPLIDAGHRLDGVRYFSGGRALGTASMSALHDTPYPFAVAVAQSATEAVIEQRLRELGGTIEKGVALVGIEEQQPDAGRVSVTLSSHGGALEDVDTAWLVGADGAHSAVRKLVGATFDGEEFDVSFAVTDAHIDGDVPTDVLSYCYSPHGSLAFGPLGTDVSRIAVSVPHQDPSAPPPSQEFFQRVANERGPGRIRVGDMRFSATFRVHARTASRFRYGRCLLAGDAAHVMSPASAQGMNTGLQDAVNLGWRLADTIHGRASMKSLEMYDRERRSASRAVVDATSMQTRWGLAKGSRIKLRDNIIRTTYRMGAFQRAVSPMVAQTGVEYRRPKPLILTALGGARRAHPGSRLPVIPTADTDNAPFDPVLTIDGTHWTAVSSARFTILMWRGSGRCPRDWAAQVKRARALVSDIAVVVEPVDGTPLHVSLGPRPAVVVVRPDGHMVSSRPLNELDDAVAQDIPSVTTRSAEQSTVGVDHARFASLPAAGVDAQAQRLVP